MNLRDAISTQPMRRVQILVIAICLVLTMIDGYEILVMAFVAPHLAKAWGLGPVEVGYLLSAGIFGMALGAAFVSPLADRIGRRRHIIGCLVLIILGMSLSAAAANVAEMAAFRAFAGLFLGAIVSSLNIIVSEFSSDRRRGTVMGIYGIGFPAGVAVGGAVTGALIAEFGWRAPFVFAAIVTAIMLVFVIAALPESIGYLIEKRPNGALEQYNRIADRLGYPRADAMPPAVSGRETRMLWKALLRGIMLPRTVFLWTGYACLIAAFYFANTWTAKLIADATGDPGLGGRTGVLISSGGVIGALLFALFSVAIRPRLVTVMLMFGGAIAYLLYARYFNAVGLALTLAVFVGIFANGGIAAYYAISPYIYPTVVRGACVGLMISFGRGVAILAPIFTGYLLRADWTPEGVYQLFAFVLVIAGLSTILLDRTYRGRSEDPETPDAPAETLAG